MLLDVTLFYKHSETLLHKEGITAKPKALSIYGKCLGLAG